MPPKAPKKQQPRQPSSASSSAPTTGDDQQQQQQQQNAKRAPPARRRAPKAPPAAEEPPAQVATPDPAPKGSPIAPGAPARKRRAASAAVAASVPEPPPVADAAEPVAVVTAPLTKYERCVVEGVRAQQLASGAEPFVPVLDDQPFDPFAIAQQELASGVMPLLVKRNLPNGRSVVVRADARAAGFGRMVGGT